MKRLTRSIFIFDFSYDPFPVTQVQKVNAEVQQPLHDIRTKSLSKDFDGSKGWNVVEYSSKLETNVNNVFNREVDITTNQQVEMVQVINMGDVNKIVHKLIL